MQCKLRLAGTENRKQVNDFHLALKFSQPRSQGLFLGLGAGREKAVTSAGQVRT